MPVFERISHCARPVSEVFDFFSRPANLVKISPPELHLKLEEGPEHVRLGDRIVLSGKRFGVSQHIVSEIIAFEPNVMFTDDQLDGPFAKWAHTHKFEAEGDGTKIIDQVDFEAPGGIAGLVITTSFIERELKWIFDYRTAKVAEILG